MQQIIFALLMSGIALATFQSADAQAPDRRRLERRRQMRREMGNRGGIGSATDFKTLKPGDAAPEFKLNSLDGKSTTVLSKFKDQRPVVLLFGSYT